MAQIIEQNAEDHAEETSAPSLSSALRRDVSTPDVSGESPFPSLIDEDQAPSHLVSLADRARGYVEPASSVNTRKAMPPTGSIFSRVPAAQPGPLLRIRKPSGSTSQPAPLEP